MCGEETIISLIKSIAESVGDTVEVIVVFKVAPKFGQRPSYTIVQGIFSKIARIEFFIFIIFSDTYTCSYVVYQV